MPNSTPGRIDLDQLRRQAKELRDAARLGDGTASTRIERHLAARPPESVNLAVAQLVIARENGFASWPRLKAAVETTQGDAGRRARSLLEASVEGRDRLAARLLEAAPGIGGHSVFTAAVLGEPDRIAALLAEDPSRALELDDERGWPPLLWVSYSRWHRTDPARGAGMREVARQLLDAGASPNANNGGRPGFDYRSALHGATRTNQVGTVRLLLERGADADDGFSIGEAAGWPDHESLRLLLDHGARLRRTWALEGAVVAGDATAVTMMLEATARVEPAERVAAKAGSALIHAVRGDVSVVEALLAHGADPRSNDEGLVRQAVRAGNDAVARVLARAGAPDDTGDADRLIGACAHVDRAAAERILAGRPRLIEEMPATDRAAVVDAAGWERAEAVAMMLDLGFPIDARDGEGGETALHSAAYQGAAATVRLLIDRGADIDARDSSYDATPLAFATVGSGERPASSGDWVETVRVLLDAGARSDGVWLSAPKDPSEAVADLLRARGVRPQEPDSTAEAEELPAGFAGSGVLAEVGEQVRTAYETGDMELFASLLHPDVRWGGDSPDGCTSREQVLAWYSDLYQRGVTASVTRVEAHADSVLVGFVWGRPAIDARPRPADARYQVFRVEDGLVVEIAGSPDLETARELSASDGA